MKYNHDNPLRVVTLCSGYDSQCLALERLKKAFPPFDYELVAWAEFDPESSKPIHEQPAVIAHNALFPQWADRNLGDMTKIDWSKVPDFDLLTYSTPCLTSDSLILTDKGYKKMENVNAGDIVLTKSNTLHPIINKFDNGVHQTCYIDSYGFENMHCTLNHKFYVREMYRYGHRMIRAFKDPEFVEAKDLNKKHYFGLPVNDESIPFITTDLDFWWMIGMYIGDGWLPAREKDNDIIIACNAAKEEKLKSKLSQDKWRWTIQKGRTCNRFRFCNKEVQDIIRRNFGTGCKNKHIPYDVIRMPKECLSAFIEGYLDSDGCLWENGKYIQFSTINRQLAYAIQLVIAKVYHRPASIMKVKVSPTKEIEGRIVNQSPYYLIRAKIEDSRQDQAFYEDGYIWYPFRKRTIAGSEHVYNIEVDEDHSYIVNGAMSKNCQSISSAGLQHGFAEGSGTRSSIIWYVREAFMVKRPKYALMENVSAMVSQKFLPMFNLWRKEVSKFGYESFAKVLNSRDFGVPQNRERIFLVSILRDELGGRQFHFPEPFRLENKLCDVLNDVTDEKYYLNPITTDKFVKDNLGMIMKYASKSDGTIEPLPDNLRQWIESIRAEDNEAQIPVSNQSRDMLSKALQRDERKD